MPTIRQGKQILDRNDLCSSCALGIVSRCVFLEAMNLMKIEQEGEGIVLSCNCHATLEMDPAYDPFDMFDNGDDL